MAEAETEVEEDVGGGALAVVERVVDELERGEEHVLALFTSERGSDEILEAIRRSVADGPVDLETERGRKTVASRAWKVRQAKTRLDEAGKNLTQDWKAKAAKVDQARKRIREGCDLIAVEVRAPLTEWEEAEKARQEEEWRVAGVREAMEEMIRNPRSCLENLRHGGSCPPIDQLGIMPGDLTDHRDRMNAALERCIAEDHAAALLEDELYALRQQNAEREAAARKAEDERKAKEEAARLEQERQEAEARAEQERVDREARIAREAAEKAAREAKEQIEAAQQAAAQAERVRIAAEAAAKERERIAAELAEQQKEAAVKEERDRIEREQAAREEGDRKTREAAEKRARSKRHRDGVRARALEAICLETLIPDHDAKDLLQKIEAGKIRHVVLWFGKESEDGKAVEA